MKEILLGILGIVILATVVFASVELSDSAPAADIASSDASSNSVSSDSTASDSSAADSKSEFVFDSEVPIPTVNSVIVPSSPRIDENIAKLWEEQGGLNEKFSDKLDKIEDSSDETADSVSEDSIDTSNTANRNGEKDPASDRRGLACDPSTSRTCAPTPAAVVCPTTTDKATWLECICSNFATASSKEYAQLCNNPSPSPTPVACNKVFATRAEWLECYCNQPVISSAAADKRSLICNPTPDSTPIPPSQGGGETNGHDIFLGAGDSGETTEEPVGQITLLAQDKGNYFMVFAESMEYVGGIVQTKVVEMDTTIPIPGATVRVYKEGQMIQQLTTNENGMVEFAVDSTGVLTYQAEVPDLQQYNDPITTVFAPEQIALQEEGQGQNNQPGGLTGLFTAVTGNWIVLLVLGILASAGYIRYIKK